MGGLWYKYHLKQHHQNIYNPPTQINMKMQSRITEPIKQNAKKSNERRSEQQAAIKKEQNWSRVLDFRTKKDQE